MDDTEAVLYRYSSKLMAIFHPNLYPSSPSIQEQTANPVHGQT